MLYTDEAGRPIEDDHVPEEDWPEPKPKPEPEPVVVDGDNWQSPEDQAQLVAEMVVEKLARPVIEHVSRYVFAKLARFRR
jgi:hypothetical protein